MAELFEINPASDNCQRWQGGRHSWRHTSEGGFDPRHYTVEAIPEAQAKSYVLANHYSGSYPAAKLRYGIFEDRALRGVLVLGVPMQAAVLSNPFPELEVNVESIELSRLVLDDDVPANAETWFIARCFEEAAVAGIRGVVSFSDPVPRRVNGAVMFPGHIGITYQAKGAVFTGRSSPMTIVLLPTGEVLSNRAMTKVRKQEAGHEYVERRLIAMGARALRAGESPRDWLWSALDEIGATRLRHRGNFRYCFKLGTKAQRRKVRIANAPLPYPKEVDAA